MMGVFADTRRLRINRTTRKKLNLESNLRYSTVPLTNTKTVHEEEPYHHIHFSIGSVHILMSSVLGQSAENKNFKLSVDETPYTALFSL